MVGAEPDLEFRAAPGVIIVMRTSRCFLFDDDGNAFDVQSPHVRLRLEAMHLGDGFLDYVVRNLGFIAVEVGPRATHVRMRPEVVAPKALGELLYWLKDSTFDRVVLWRHQATGYAQVLLGNARTAVHRIGRIVLRAQTERRGELLSRRVDITKLAADDPFRALLEARAELQSALERLDIAAIGELASRTIGDRYAISRADGPHEDVVVERVGAGYEDMAGYWLKRVVGHRMSDLPSPVYGAWAADAYSTALQSGTASVDDVDALVSWPGQAPRRYRYRRLLIPAHGPNGSSRILSATLATRGIDLRSGTAEELA